ncbi:MAG: LPS assembly protein LptD [Verrucomicrobiota bacterium]
MKQLRALCLIFIFCGIAVATRAQDELAWKIESQTEQGFFEYDPATGTGYGTNGVIIIYSNIVLTANSVTANDRTGDVTAEGNVTINSRGVLWTGDRVFYNFKTEQMQSDIFKAGQNPFFIAGEGLEGNQSNQTYLATNVIVTTDDYAEPAFKIRARKIKVVPGKYFVAEGATMRIGDVPVFYFPYYRRTLGARINHFDFTPGYRSKFGPYLLGTYNFYTQEKIDGALHFDYRQKRGFAGGPELLYRLGKFGDGKMEYYYAQDEKPGVDFRTNAISEQRHRIAFSHQATVRTNLTVKAVANYQSDPFVDRDFFESEYRRNVQPKSLVEVNQLWPNFSLDVLAQPQVNDFQETVERLPDIKLTALRQQLWNTPLYYEGENSVGYFHRAFVDNSTNYSAARADSFHQIILPQTYFGWLNFTPRVGGRFTYYSEADGRGATTDEQTRGVFNTGAEVSFKSSRVWVGAENKFFDVHGLRHIIEPSVNYAYVPRPNVRPPELPQFDYELQSLRTLPIEFPQYNSIDSIDAQNVVRLGLRNRIQTKRENGVDNLLNWSLFTDWRIKPGINPTSGTNQTRQTTFAPLTSSLEFRPRSWITFQSDTRYDLNRRRLIEADHRLVLEPNNVWSTSLGHRFLDDAPINGPGPGHNLITTSFYYRMNENWAARMSHHFEARDGTMEEQYYTVYRDLRSWTAALTFRVRDNRTGSDDYTIAATFSLKAFPRFGLNSDRDRPSLLVGY